MSPARGVLDARGQAPLRPIQRVVAGERIGMHHAGEPGQVFARPLALPVGRVAVERSRRPRTGMGSWIHGIDPKPRQPRLAGAGCERADRRVVGVQHRLRHHRRTDQPGQGCEPPGGATDPVGQGHAVDLYALPRQDHRLAEQRQAVAVFRDRHMRDQARAGAATLDRQVGGWGLEHRLAHPAGVAGPDVADDLQPGGDLLQHLGDVLAEPGELAWRAAAAQRRGLMRHGLARQMLRQRAADGLRTGAGVSTSRSRARDGRLALGLVLLEVPRRSSSWRMSASSRSDDWPYRWRRSAANCARRCSISTAAVPSWARAAANSCRRAAISSSGVR